ncbi:cobaltochelatase subunit CobN [Chelatococcus sp. SYSU_G07232]|uniref:Cobaltochelatase subunit CobN n=1 Tax=Chelatococcus albus TaxID=3047466 RepID=A0ABT7AHI4_9HYPH|nr:cobaltochelatase subunit CobN [Chelatococcus sp. SYSU_G07232]MDJ1158834.1 cobaltochelatase subunit CobN [Chelatococcus sp. SYSU_G07232]
MHLLPVTTVGLDAAEAPVDLGHSPAEIVILSFTDTDLSAFAAAWTRDRAVLPSLRLANLQRLRHPLSVDLYVERVVASARFVLVRCLGGLDYHRYGLTEMARACRAGGIPFVALAGDDRPDPRLKALCTADAALCTELDAYARAGGVDNLRQALRRIAAELGADLAVAPPRPVPAAGVWDPGVGEPMVAARATRPVALVVFYRSILLAGDTAPIEALAAALAARGMEPVCLYVPSLKDAAAAAEVERLLLRRRPRIVLNATAFSARRDDGTTVLDMADCPVLQVVLAGASRDAWAESARGLGAADLAMNVVLPELDGRIGTTPVSFKGERTFDPALEFAPVQHVPDDAQVALIADRAAAWLRLAETPRRERRIALVLSDYPSREGRAGYAVGLDTERSAARIVRWLGEEGYAIGPGLAADGALARLAAGAETAAVPLARYRQWLDETPEPFRRALAAAWGPPEEDPALVDGAFRFPVLTAGNVVVALQPDRGRVAARKADYHDPTLPPRHAYAAFYAFLRAEFDAHALVHLGTHGTLEWLPGKAAALSPACAPQVLAGPLPVVYPFIVNNPGEAAVARRRIAAVTVGHLTPPLVHAGLHGAAATLEGLLDEYAVADGLDRQRQRHLKAAIVAEARASGLAAECGAGEEDDDALVTRLDAWLCDLKELAIRDGLHVFGEPPPPEARKAMLAALAAAAPGTPADLLAARLDACAAAERRALLAALDGRFVPAGPAGAPTRGRLDVLPTGRNLATVDPRSIPTRTAALVGERAAAEVLRRYLQDHGDWPRALLLDLWASATLRTGGDDLAQALSFLGVRPVWDHASNRVTGVEVLPAARLDRPRIDVTLRISGLFRDAFAAQIALFDQAVRAVAALDEDDAFNPLAAARRRGEDLARVFGGAPGAYGAGSAVAALDGRWDCRADLGEAYLAASGFAYAGRGEGCAAAEAFRERVRRADALVHAQDDRERDILDGDGAADFIGGFAAAAAALGAAPALLHLDTSWPDAPRARTVAEEIARLVRGRLTHPRWIAGQMRHGFRGAAELAQGLDALYAFAATSDTAGSAAFEAVFDAWVADEAVWRTLRAANPGAARAIASRFDEALARGLWVTRRNSVAPRLAEALGPERGRAS